MRASYQGLIEVALRCPWGRHSFLQCTLCGSLGALSCFSVISAAAFSQSSDTLFYCFLLLVLWPAFRRVGHSSPFFFLAFHHCFWDTILR